MTVPAERLTAVDVYHFIDWTREAFAKGDDLYEVEIWEDGQRRLRLRSTLDFHIRRLEAVIAHMSDPHYAKAAELVARLKRARISESVDVANVLADLRTVVAYWDQSRPRLECGCGLTFRSERQLAEHLALIHEQEVA